MSQLKIVQEKIIKACERSQRDFKDVTLIAVSKTWSREHILACHGEGQTVFGENKLQELELKSPTLPSEIEWHYIGKLQRNKIRKVLQYSRWIHSVDNEKLLLGIDRIAGEEGVKPNICLQVNIDLEQTKSGFLPEMTAQIVLKAKQLKQLNLVGLMCIPSPRAEVEEVRPSFKALFELREMIQKETQVSLPALSMGMSNDYEIAIEEGATHLRVGSAIFGSRVVNK